MMTTRTSFKWTAYALMMRIMPMVGVLSIGIMTVILCSQTNGFQEGLLKTLNAQGFSLVEIGSFGKIRTLGFSRHFFETRKLSDGSALVGVSDLGDHLLMDVRPLRRDFSQPAHYELDITTLRGEVVTRVQPIVRGLAVFSAELSPNRNLIAFVGYLAKPFQKPGSFGLHLLKVSGEIETLVATAEAEEPQSIGWSRDGEVIVYDSVNRIFLYHLETGVSSLLTTGNNPTWSPDGSWIAYRRPDGTAGLISPDGNHAKQILGKVQLRRGFRWSPDSRYVLYTDYSAGGIRVLDIADGGIATVFVPIDQYDESRLRWVHGLHD